jgi:uncharacterized coiled-coil protein SlyX
MKIIRWFKTIRELNEAHDAQNAVLRRMQAELDAMRRERDAAFSQITFLNRAIERLQAPRQ